MCRGGGGVDPQRAISKTRTEIHHKSDKTNLLAYSFCRHHPACKDTPHMHPTRCVTPQHACKPAAPPQLIPFLDSFSSVFEWIGRQKSTHVLQSGYQWARGGVCNRKTTRSETKEQNSAHKKILSGQVHGGLFGGGGGKNGQFSSIGTLNANFLTHHKHGTIGIGVCYSMSHAHTCRVPRRVPRRDYPTATVGAITAPMQPVVTTLKVEQTD